MSVIFTVPVKQGTANANKILGALSKIAKRPISFMSVYLSVWNKSAPAGWIFMEFEIGGFYRKSAPAGWIFMEFDIGGFYRKSVEKLKFL
jgi:hypothetical protein